MIYPVFASSGLWWVRARRLVLVGGLLWCLTGCSPAEAGYMGVSVDGDGAPVAVMALCEGHVDGVQLSLDEGAEDFMSLARMEAAHPVEGSAEVRLAAPGSEWTVEKPFGELVEDATYTLSGWSEGDGAWLATVSFGSEALAGLEPGQVWWQKYDEEREVDVEMVGGTADFMEHACDDWVSSAGFWTF